MATVYSSVPTLTTELVLFGGQNSSTNDFGDTWIYQDGNWSRVATPIHPPARASASMVYDAADHYVVLFGGVNLTTGQVYNDTWIFTGSVWIQLALTHAPPARYGAASTWAFATVASGLGGPHGGDHFGYVLLFGGQSGPNAYLADTWKFVGGQWTLITTNPKSGPLAASYAMMSDDLDDGNPVLSGGYDGTLQSDFWIFR